MQNVLRKQTLLHTTTKTLLPSLSTTTAMAIPSPPPSSSSSVSSPFLTPHSLSSNLNPNRSFLFFKPRSTTKTSIKLSSKQQQQPNSPPSLDIDDAEISLSSPEKRSFAVATGELFLGIASRIIGRGGRRKEVVEEEAKEKSAIPRVSELEYGERIANVVEDTLQPEVLWEQRVKDVEAEKRRREVTSPGFSFSAAGLLFPYHLGVAQFLIENGYIKETTPLAGSSAGAIVCAVIASGKGMQEALQATKVLAEDCRLRGTAFRLGAVLRDILVQVLPDDIHTRCNGRVRVAVTQIVWRPKGLLIDQFDSKEDLINALFTSSFIPGSVFVPSLVVVCGFMALGLVQTATQRIG